MNKKNTTNSVFPYLDNTIKLKPIFLGTNQVSYDKRVKIKNWHEELLSEPLDNNDFFPPKGHLRMSSYKKLGTYGPQNYLTETKEKIKNYKPVDLRKCSKSVQLLNMFSFPFHNVPHKKLEVENERKSCLENISKTDEELPNIYRRTLGYSSEDIEKLEGVRTFLDDDLEIHKKISTLKMKFYSR